MVFGKLERFVRKVLGKNCISVYKAKMIYEYRDYQQFLKAELVNRIKQNPSFSLRAFAKQLGLAASTMSEVLSGKTHLSHKRARSVASRLGLSGTHVQFFTLLVEYSKTNSESEKNELEKIINELNPNSTPSPIEKEKFFLIKDWYHIPLLVLASVNSFRLNPISASKALELPVGLVSDALNRLEKLSLIERDENKKSYIRSNQNLRIESHEQFEALQDFHKTMLDKAKKAVELQNNNEKYIGSETFLLSVKNHSRASEIIDDCFKKLISLSEEDQVGETYIYHAGIQMFKLTNSLRGD